MKAERLHPDLSRHRGEPQVDLVSFEATFSEGLAQFAIDELEAVGVDTGKAHVREDRVRCDMKGDWRPLTTLRSVNAVYALRQFAVARPRALLGHQHFNELAGAVETVIRAWPPGSFRTLAVSAAGSDSGVMVRLREELAARVGLSPTNSTEGDMLLRLRPNDGGWEAMVRTSPRPLSTRSWRAANMPGALNGPVAHVMALMTGPTEADRILNIACGSGSLLRERADIGPFTVGVGVDVDERALKASTANLSSSKAWDRIGLVRGDAARLPLRDGSVDVVMGDLPFGKLVGGHSENEALYPRLLDEIVRVTRTNGRIVLITHDIRLMERLLTQRSRHLVLRETTRTRLGAMSPRIYRIVRSESSG
jgi:tRNA (guanine6-N2)-methyltransferase